MLKTVYFGVDGQVAKAIIDEKFLDFFTGLGATRVPYEVVPDLETTSKSEEVKEKPKPVKTEVSEGDLGHGEPGSDRFHTLGINELESMDQIQKYVKEVTGKLILKTKKSTLESFRKKALKTIQRHLKNGG